MAYRLARNHGLSEGANYVEAEWLAGWISSRFLGDHSDALQHFINLYKASRYPISRARGADVVLVAQESDGGGIVGFGNCGRARHDTALGGAMGEVYTLYVANDWQGRGIGRALLSGLFDSLQGHGINQAMVWVLSGNPARFFYEAMGGDRLAERREPFSGTVLDETAYFWSNLGEWLAARAGGDLKQ